MKLFFANKISEINLLKLRKKKKFKIFAANPKIQAFLKKNNIKFINTLNFFYSLEHRKSIQYTDYICKKVFKITKIKENHLFYNTFFYFRFYISTIIYSHLIIRNIKRIYKNNIYVSQNGNWIKYNISLKDIIFAFEEKNEKKNYIKRIISLIFISFNYLYLYFILRKKNKIVINSNDYNLGLKINNLYKKNKNLSIISVNSSLSSFFSLKKINKNYYSFFLRNISIFKYKNINKLNYLKVLNQNMVKICLKKFNIKIDNDLQKMFCHNILIKLESFLDKDCFIKFFLKNIKKIKLIISQHSLDTASSLYNYAKLQKIKTLCISHGTYSYTKNKFANLEWKVHSKTMINNNNDFILSNSKIMTDFINKSEIGIKNDQIIKIDPFLFSTNQKKKISLSQINIIKKNLKIEKNKKIILHAGSPKLGRCVVYETIDEYIANIKKILFEIKNSNYFLIISFRPYKNLDYFTFKELLPPYSNYCISSNISINELIQLSDIIMSFSSTVIEESLYLNKPVILFDPNKIYNHYDNDYLNKFKFFNKKLYVDSKKKLLNKFNQASNLNGKINFSNKIYYPKKNLLKELNLHL
jgi:CDP-glycerol glycerophosphotransferase (TagB/SpsB family)